MTPEGLEQASMRLRRILLPLLVLGLLACEKPGSDDSPAPSPAVAASESAARQKAREELEARKREEERQRKEEEQTTMRLLADEAEAAAKARESDRRFHGMNAAQLKAAARRECRAAKCNPDVLSEIVESARPEDTESVRCVARFEEDSWQCRQGINPALCDPPPCP
jgi:hypothetical protein